MTDKPKKESEKTAVFTERNGVYHPENKVAVALCSVLSKSRLSRIDLVTARAMGYTTRLQNGQEIGKVDVRA